MPKRPTRKRGIKAGRIVDWPAKAGSPEEVASQVTYSGSPIHKTYESSAGPPAYRADEAKCDRYELKDWAKLREALREAIRAKCVGEFRGGFPSRAWVWINGVLHEARQTGWGGKEYHGMPLDKPTQYPLPRSRLKDAPRVKIPSHRA